MLQWLMDIDKQWFLAINSLNSPFWDEIMYWFSEKFTWLPLYAFIIYFAVRKYKKHSWKVILFMLLTLVLTDQISVLIKNFVMRPRPSHTVIFDTVIHLNHGIKGGLYGFVSSHAANTSGLASFIIFLNFFQSKTAKILIILWVLLVSYSRIYNGLHYPLDVLAGIFLGIFIGYCTSYATKIVILKNKKY